MTLTEYVNAFPRVQRMEVRRWLAGQLGISEIYVRSMCNGIKPIPAKFALRLEKITGGVIPRHTTAPEMYPFE
jgi:DNA-binding transcriptional regulator YdaS (Cro superfamily)